MCSVPSQTAHMQRNITISQLGNHVNKNATRSMADEERRLGDWLSSWPHKDAHADCCVRPGPNIAVRVEFMARHISSQAGNETSEVFETLFVSFPCVSIAIDHRIA
jgi:hypothetical protein